MIKHEQKLHIANAKGQTQKKPMTFGDFVEGVYQTWGKRKAKGVVQLAVAAHMVEFCGPERFVIS